jgi:hypothetical protein
VSPTACSRGGAATRASAPLPRLADTIARLVEFDLFVTDERGRTRRSRFRVLTTLLDHVAYPARRIAAVYAERWQAEVAYYRLKVTLRGNGVILRGQTSNLARQEVWALLCVIFQAHPPAGSSREPKHLRRKRSDRGAHARMCSVWFAVDPRAASVRQVRHEPRPAPHP